MNDIESAWDQFIAEAAEYLETNGSDSEIDYRKDNILYNVRSFSEKKPVVRRIIS